MTRCRTRRWCWPRIARWGSDMLPRLLGDFAFALWDGRERRLMLARDPRGIRSIAYAVRRRLRSVRDRAAPVAARERRRCRAQSGICRRTPDAASSSHPVGHDLPRHPACAGRARADGDIGGRRRNRLTTHWDIDPRRELRYADDAQYAEHLRELYSSAVSGAAARARSGRRAAQRRRRFFVDRRDGVAAESGRIARRGPRLQPCVPRTIRMPTKSRDAERARASTSRVPFVSCRSSRRRPRSSSRRARRLEDTIPGTSSA